jgi:hypothetical protein
MSGKILQFLPLATISTGNHSIGSVLYTVAFEEFYKISVLAVRTLTPKSLKDSVIE